MVGSTKGATGHMLGAAGAIEAAFTALALRDARLPPSLNLDAPLSFEAATTVTTAGEENGGRNVSFASGASGGQSWEADYAMSNSFGFGGTNASLLFRKWVQ